MKKPLSTPCRELYNLITEVIEGGHVNDIKLLNKLYWAMTNAPEHMQIKGGEPNAEGRTKTSKSCSYWKSN